MELLHSRNTLSHISAVEVPLTARIIMNLPTTFLAAACCLSLGAQAATYSFSCLSGNDAVNCADGAASLVMEVSDAGNNQVDFTFRNHGLLGSAITEIYFDDGTLLAIDLPLIDSGAGVDFTNIGVSPGTLPAGNEASPPFVTTAGFAVDVVKKTQDGIENKMDGAVLEFLTIRYDLQSGKTFDDTIRSLNGEIVDGGAPALRVGLHVRAFSNGGSESFLNDVASVPAAPVPEADAYALVALGMGWVGLLAYRRKA